ncbi:hypothetical protein ACHAWF_002293, partial [Thalassiosira exigua]
RLPSSGIPLRPPRPPPIPITRGPPRHLLPPRGRDELGGLQPPAVADAAPLLLLLLLRGERAGPRGPDPLPPLVPLVGDRTAPLPRDGTPPRRAGAKGSRRRPPPPRRAGEPDCGAEARGLERLREPGGQRRLRRVPDGGGQFGHRRRVRRGQRERRRKRRGRRGRDGRGDGTAGGVRLAGLPVGIRRGGPIDGGGGADGVLRRVVPGPLGRGAALGVHAGGRGAVEGRRRESRRARRGRSQRSESRPRGCLRLSRSDDPRGPPLRPASPPPLRSEDARPLVPPVAAVGADLHGGRLPGLRAGGVGAGSEGFRQFGRRLRRPRDRIEPHSPPPPADVRPPHLLPPCHPLLPILPIVNRPLLFASGLVRGRGLRTLRRDAEGGDERGDDVARGRAWGSPGKDTRGEGVDARAASRRRAPGVRGAVPAGEGGDREGGGEAAVFPQLVVGRSSVRRGLAEPVG